MTDPQTPTEEKPGKKDTFEEFKVEGDKLVAKVKEIVKEGHAKRIIIKDEEGKVLMEIPLTFGVVGALFAPTLAALGAIAALVADCTITIEKK